MVRSVEMDEQTHNRCAQFVVDNLPSWTYLFQQLIRIPSSFEAEHEIVHFVARYIEQLGVPVHRVPHDPHVVRNLRTAAGPISLVQGRDSLVVRVRGKTAGPSLVLNAHLDTVPEGDAAEWMNPPYSAHVDVSKNIIYGRGAMDDKAGVVISLAVLETILGLPLSVAGDAIFHYVLEDETTGNGSLLCLHAGYGADAAVIIDGTREDRAINQHAGHLQFELKVSGRPASVVVSHAGVNAAEVIAALILYLRSQILALNQHVVAPWSQFPSPFQLVPTKIISTSDHSTVPTQATAAAHVIFPPPYTVTEMREFIVREINAFSAARGLPERPVPRWEGLALEPIFSDVSRLEPFLRESASATGLKFEGIGPSTGTSDLRHFVDAQIPCVLYGPGPGYNPHRWDEHYLLDGLPKMILFFLELIDRWCDKETLG